MSETTERVAIHDNEILEIKSEIKDIKSMQSEIISKFHQHDKDSAKYQVLVDELITEKKSKIASRNAITSKLIESSIWGAILLLLTLAWVGLQNKLHG